MRAHSRFIRLNEHPKSDSAFAQDSSNKIYLKHCVSAEAEKFRNLMLCRNYASTSTSQSAILITESGNALGGLAFEAKSLKRHVRRTAKLFGKEL
jgi:hypothetical protein